jgi:hypothetical protein
VTLMTHDQFISHSLDGGTFLPYSELPSFPVLASEPTLPSEASAGVPFSFSSPDVLPDYQHIDTTIPAYSSIYEAPTTKFKAKEGILSVVFICPVPNAPFPIYAPSDKLTGKVRVEISDDVKMENIIVSLKGRSFTSLNEGSGRARGLEIRDVCQFLSLSKKIWDIKSRSPGINGPPYISLKDDGSIIPGTYEIPFQLEIPSKGRCLHGKEFFKPVDIPQSCRLEAKASIQSVYYFLEVGIIPI